MILQLFMFWSHVTLQLSGLVSLRFALFGIGTGCIDERRKHRYLKANWYPVMMTGENIGIRKKIGIPSSRVSVCPRTVGR